MVHFLLSTLNGLSYGLLLFVLGAGLTLTFSLMGVLNFAHAAFYLLGAYLGHEIAGRIGFWPAMLLAPLAVGALGAAFEWALLRRARGHLAELLLTFGVGYVIVEAAQLVWGRSPLDFQPPELLRGPLLTLVQASGQGLGWVWGAAGELCRAPAVACAPFPATRAMIAVVALAMLLALWALLAASRIGLVIRAALTHPQAVEALGHDLPRIRMLVFGAGSALAGWAGVVGGSTFVTEPTMAAAVGSVVFVVVVVGGMGSLAGAFVAALLIGLLQTFAVAFDQPIAAMLGLLPALADSGAGPASASPAWQQLTLAQVAPMSPYLLLLVVLLVRPNGLLGARTP